jgi:DNA-binding transcriptional ArsR family regulator
MSRAATTSDVFNAIAEPERRRLIGFLADGQSHSVGQLVEAMQLAQPAVSKHLGVLRAVGIVSVERVGKSRLYALNPAELKPVHDWVKPFERYWTQQLDRIKQRAERKAAERSTKN